MSWAVIATWDFSLKGVNASGGILGQGGSALDAVEQAARLVEEDPEVDTVGFGGFPNGNGEVELDAAIMNGKDMAIGAIAALKGFMHPVSVARRVMTDTPHTFLVGQGAEDFAAAKGFSRNVMITEKVRKAWEQRVSDLEKGKPVEAGHDTVGVVALDSNGDMAVATSTSGLAMKYRGRVGDSPLVGSGFFVDNDVGGAAATGQGEDIMKCCTCFYAVDLMRQGYTPQKAAEEAVRHTHERLSRYSGKPRHIAVVCADNKGNFGGAANHGEFAYAAASQEREPKVYIVESLKDLK